MNEPMTKQGASSQYELMLAKSALRSAKRALVCIAAIKTEGPYYHLEVWRTEFEIRSVIDNLEKFMEERS